MYGTRGTQPSQQPLMACSRCGEPMASGFRLVVPRDLDGEAPFVCVSCREYGEEAWPADEADYLQWVLERLRASTEAVLAAAGEARRTLLDERCRSLGSGIVDLATVRSVRRRSLAILAQLEELDTMRETLWPVLAGSGLLSREWLAWSARVRRQVAALKSGFGRPAGAR